MEWERREPPLYSWNEGSGLGVVLGQPRFLLREPQCVTSDRGKFGLVEACWACWFSRLAQRPMGMNRRGRARAARRLRSGWRVGGLWWVCTGPFPAENDLALVAQLASLFATKDIGLRYVYDVGRLTDHERARIDEVQGTLEALPEPLLGALRWSSESAGER